MDQLERFKRTFDSVAEYFGYRVCETDYERFGVLLERHGAVAVTDALIKAMDLPKTQGDFISVREVEAIIEENLGGFL